MSSLPCAEPEFWEDDDEMTGPVSRFLHKTVMPRELVAALSPRPGGLYIDVTLGGGGHSEALLELEPSARVIGFDRDPRALEAARERLARFGDRFRAEKASFDEVPEVLSRLGIARVDGIMADLGVSSPQLDDPGRGMSFRLEGPLDMRMDPTSGETAAELIHRLSTDELADIIYIYGEERRSRRIARCVKQADEAGELQTTLDLRRAVVRAVGPARIGGVDPATRSFQALRIAVNDELGQIEALLSMAPGLLAPGGALSVLSFHSLEDRLVKRAFQQRSVWSPIWRKPQGPSDEEVAQNPRSRSAKLRAARTFAEGIEGEYDENEEGDDESFAEGAGEGAEAWGDEGPESARSSLPPPSSRSSSPPSRRSSLPPLAKTSAASGPSSSRGASVPPASASRTSVLPPPSVSRARALHMTTRGEGAE